MAKLSDGIGFRVSGFGFRKEPTARLSLFPSPEPRNPKPDLRHRAFTLAELIIGLLLLALIGGATAAVASAVARGWEVGASGATSTLTISRTMLRVQDKIQRAKVLGQYRAGSVDSPANPGAALLFWREDDGDGRMQLDETQLIEYDPTTKNLLVWEVAFPDPVTRAAQNGPFPTSILTDPTAIDDYKSLPYKRTYAMTRNVLGAAFNVITPTSASSRPTFEFRFKFDGPDGKTVEYGTASPRAPHKE